MVISFSFFFVLCFYYFVPTSREKKQQNFQPRTRRTLNSSSSSPPFLSSFPTFQLKTLTLCNDFCLGMVRINSPVIYFPSLSSSSSSSQPLSWTAASQITVANDFYVKFFFIDSFFKRTPCNAERFQFFLLKIPSCWEIDFMLFKLILTLMLCSFTLCHPLELTNNYNIC